MKLPRCPRCEAAKVGQVFHCRSGTLSPAQMNTRVCRYGRPKGGCINDCIQIIPEETFEARSELPLNLKDHPELT